jgi:NTP pyrophosphatase (non-canonical NTP hydrolase)
MTIKDQNKSHEEMTFLMEMHDVDLPQLIWDICKWAEDRNITAEGGATSYTQIPKLIEEVYEFRDATTEEEAKLEFGDILVVCIQIARLRGLDMVECLDLAYKKIKDRKGTMIDGRFVKEQ